MTSAIGREEQQLSYQILEPIEDSYGKTKSH